MNFKLVTALHKVISQDLSGQQLSTRLRQLDENYGFYNKTQQTYLQKIYLDSYRYGENAVPKDVFTDQTQVTFSDIRDRFKDYVKVDEEDWDFIARLAEGSQIAIKEILQASSQPGFENDFDYDMYEKYFIDGSRQLEEDENFKPEEGLNEDKIFFVSDLAYSDGVGRVIWEYGSQIIKQLANALLEKKN